MFISIIHYVIFSIYSYIYCQYIYTIIFITIQLKYFLPLSTFWTTGSLVYCRYSERRVTHTVWYCSTHFLTCTNCNVAYTQWPTLTYIILHIVNNTLYNELKARLLTFFICCCHITLNGTILYTQVLILQLQAPHIRCLHNVNIALSNLTKLKVSKGLQSIFQQDVTDTFNIRNVYKYYLILQSASLAFMLNISRSTPSGPQSICVI